MPRYQINFKSNPGMKLRGTAELNAQTENEALDRFFSVMPDLVEQTSIQVIPNKKPITLIDAPGDEIPDLPAAPRNGAA